MNNSDGGADGLKMFNPVRRKPISLADGLLTATERLDVEAPLPLVIRPVVEALNLATWAEGKREFIEARLWHSGAILFRDFPIASVNEFERFIAAVSDKMLQYDDGSSPRSRMSEWTYTSTEYPPNETIFLHNELSYAQSWPSKIFFYCVTPALEGGETPLADCRAVYARLNPQLRERFARRQVMYVRNFNSGFGLTWQSAFNTTDRNVVERFCRRNQIELEWKDGERLRTRQVRPAIGKHYQTNEMVWFNHAHFFHVSSLDQRVRESLLAQFKMEDIPFNTYYGDGSPIEDSVLDEIREAFSQEKYLFNWQKSDVLLLDNMLVAHGREPFKRPRQVLVGMSDPREHDTTPARQTKESG
jgi:alpha-ketoglutarate-dependent taurine dioxygenase